MPEVLSLHDVCELGDGLAQWCDSAQRPRAEFHGHLCL